MMSTRKPHNDLAGYVCERKSKHPKLPGYFVIFDKDKGGDWVTGSDSERYALVHVNPAEQFGGIVCFKGLPSARAVMVDMCNGSNVADMGQHEPEETQP